MVPRHPAQLYEALFYGCVLVFGLNLSDNSVMRGRLDAIRTLKGLVADLRHAKKNSIVLQMVRCRTLSKCIPNTSRTHPEHLE